VIAEMMHVMEKFAIQSFTSNNRIYVIVTDDGQFA
jgi:hypothetical protein